MPIPTLVIDLGARNVRVLVYRGSRILRWGKISLGTTEQYDRGVLSDPDDALRRYHKLFSSLGIQKAKARVLVPSVLAVGDTIAVPRGLPRSRVPLALRSLAIKQLGSSDGLELYIQYRTIQKDPALEVFALGVLRKELLDHLTLLRRAGVIIERTELDTLALARWFDSVSGLVVYMDGDGFDNTLVLRHGKPVQAYARAAVLSDAPEERLRNTFDVLTSVRRSTAVVPACALSGPRARVEDLTYLRSQGINARGLTATRRLPDGFPTEEYLAALGAVI